MITLNKDQTIGVLILLICALLALTFVALLLFYDPNIVSFLNLGALVDVRFWLIAAPVTIAFMGIMIIGAWIGWTMFAIPRSKLIEEITSETETPA